MINLIKKLEMKIANKTVGVSPIERKHILASYDGKEDPSTITDYEIFLSHKFRKARIDAAYDFLEIELKFDHDDIKVVNAEMCRNPYSGILWIEVTEGAVKKIFQRAAKYRRKNVQLMTYFPKHLYRRKRNLDVYLRRQRQLEPRLRTQICLGQTDISLVTKYADEPYWKEINVNAYGDPSVDPVYSPPRQRPSVDMVYSPT